jgi:hypothetical protein
MLRPGRPLAALLCFVLFGLGCLPPSADDPCALTGCPEPGSSGELAGSTAVDESSSTTGEPVTSGSTSSTTNADDSTTTGEAEPPPRILAAKWTENPLLAPGVTRLEVIAADVDGIFAWLGGDILKLTPSEDDPNMFVGEFEATSELADGTYLTELVPLRGDLAGEPFAFDLDVDLPMMGSEGHWDANPGLGDGLAGTLLPGPDGDLFEFGTLDLAGVPRCYLRRRDADGKAGPNDMIAVQPGEQCTGVDAANDIDGTLLLLSEVTSNGTTQWQLDRHDPWNNTLETEMWGTAGMKGNAVAVGPAGQIVVCGSAPSGMGDTDVAIRHENPDGGATFDLKYDANQPANDFSEVANDCTFVGSTLVLAGDAEGPHPDGNSTRHTTIEYDLHTKQASWNVAAAPPAPLVNSSAQAITRDGFGGYISAGHVCEAPCFPQIELRQFAPGGALLGSFRTTAKTTAATGIAWHPAGYAVVSAGEIITGNWTKIWAQAWIPGQAKDLWTYSQSYTEGVHWALDVAVGQYGWIHLVGVADLGNGVLVPAFVSVYP